MLKVEEVAFHPVDSDPVGLQWRPTKSVVSRTNPLRLGKLPPRLFDEIDQPDSLKSSHRRGQSGG